MERELYLAIVLGVTANGINRAEMKYNKLNFNVGNISHVTYKHYEGLTSYTLNEYELDSLDINEDNICSLETLEKLYNFLFSKLNHKDVYILQIEPDYEITFKA